MPERRFYTWRQPPRIHDRAYAHPGTTAISLTALIVGGGLIKPMQTRWESYLVKAEEELPKVKAEAANTPSVREQAKQAKDKLDDSSQTSGEGTRVDDQRAGSPGSSTYKP